MAAISQYELFVIGDNLSIDFDAVYADRAEAEEAAKKLDAAPAMFGMKLKYRVLTLADAIDEAKRDAEDRGRDREEEYRRGGE